MRGRCRRRRDRSGFRRAGFAGRGAVQSGQGLPLLGLPVLVFDHAKLAAAPGNHASLAPIIGYWLAGFAFLERLRRTKRRHRRENDGGDYRNQPVHPSPYSSPSSACTWRRRRESAVSTPKTEHFSGYPRPRRRAGVGPWVCPNQANFRRTPHVESFGAGRVVQKSARARWDPDRRAVEFGVSIGEYAGVVRVPQDVLRRFIDGAVPALRDWPQVARW